MVAGIDDAAIAAGATEGFSLSSTFTTLAWGAAMFAGAHFAFDLIGPTVAPELFSDYKDTVETVRDGILGDADGSRAAAGFVLDA